MQSAAGGVSRDIIIWKKAFKRMIFSGAGICDISGEYFFGSDRIIPFRNERFRIEPPVSSTAGIEHVGQYYGIADIPGIQRLNAAPDTQAGISRQIMFLPAEEKLSVVSGYLQIGKELRCFHIVFHKVISIRHPGEDISHFRFGQKIRITEAGNFIGQRTGYLNTDRFVRCECYGIAVELI